MSAWNPWVALSDGTHVNLDHYRHLKRWLMPNSKPGLAPVPALRMDAENDYLDVTGGDIDRVLAALDRRAGANQPVARGEAALAAALDGLLSLLDGGGLLMADSDAARWRERVQWARNVLAAHNRRAGAAGMSEPPAEEGEF